MNYLKISIVLALSFFIAHASDIKDDSMKNRKANRLLKEQSPYLLQHAYNPVDWYPWGEEAFKMAKEDDKPIFLSIGYSTCHWCHVMEKESFENDEVARLLNEAFICIKVDREERPDLDNIYMNVCQMLTGSGGWPLTVVLTPELQPFFAGTYFPPKSKMGIRGLDELIPLISKAWEENRSEVVSQANQITAHLQRSQFASASGEVDDKTLDLAFESYAAAFDSAYGGFAARPKFPTPHNLLFLLKYGERKKSQQALQMVTKTLEQMRLGGIYDQLGLGFHRYSTDEKWLIPHFEKMLYDQALLLMAYSEAAVNRQFSDDKRLLFQKTSLEIVEYVKEMLTDSAGGFYSAEDADTEGREGLFYIWSDDELKKALTESEFQLLQKVYTKEPLHEHGHAGSLGDVLYLRKSPFGEGEREYDALRQKLKALREKRQRPFRDDKILSDWNGLMIAALAVSARRLDDEQSLKMAEKAALFTWNKLYDEKNGLRHRYRNGESSINATLEDYAFLSLAMAELFQTTSNAEYLSKAITLVNKLWVKFYDEKTGKLFLTEKDQKDLILRPHEIYDGAIPSGNSVAALTLVKLQKITGEPFWEERFEKLLKSTANGLNRTPMTHAMMLNTLELFRQVPVDAVVVVDEKDMETNEKISILREHLGDSAVIIIKKEENKRQLSEMIPFVRQMKTITGKTTVYLCQNFSCQRPVYHKTDIERLVMKTAP